MTLSDAGVTFNAVDPPLHFISTHVEKDFTSGPARLTATDGARQLKMDVRERLCADARTGMPFPVQVTVRVDGRHFEGCGGETITVLEGGWRVIRMGGVQMPRHMTVVLVFTRSGELSGRLGCNRFVGRYTLSTDALHLGPVTFSPTTCSESAPSEWQQFLALLAGVNRVMPGDQVRLNLMAGDVQAFVLDRVD